MFHRALEVENNNLLILNELGRLYKKRGKYEQVLQRFDRIVSIFDNDIIAPYEAAKIHKK